MTSAASLADGPAARLSAAPGAQRVPTRELELFIVRGFLDAPTCAELIERIDRQRRPSEIADDIGVANYRTSETCDLDWRDPVVGAVDDRICALLGFPPRTGEPLQGQRYAPGQEFKPHTDTFEPGGYDFYLHTGKTVQPETGKLLAWNNLLADGRPNPATLHQGMKVRRGTKYVLTKWFRQQPS
jgi:prolyl 4-hydroxylase